MQNVWEDSCWDVDVGGRPNHPWIPKISFGTEPEKVEKVKGGESQRQLLTLTLSTKSVPSTAPSNAWLLRLSDMSLSQSLSPVVEVGMAGQGHGVQKRDSEFYWHKISGLNENLNFKESCFI